MRLGVPDQLPRQLDRVAAAGDAGEVAAQVAEAALHGGVLEAPEVPPALGDLHGEQRERLERPAEAAPGGARPPREGGELSPLAAEERDHAVALAVVDGAQDHGPELGGAGHAGA